MGGRHGQETHRLIPCRPEKMLSLIQAANNGLRLPSVGITSLVAISLSGVILMDIDLVIKLTFSGLIIFAGKIAKSRKGLAEDAGSAAHRD